MLLASTALFLSACQLLPDKLVDIIKPHLPNPNPNLVSCILSEISYQSKNPDVEYPFKITIDTTGEFKSDVLITQTSKNGNIVEEIKPDAPNVLYMQHTEPDGYYYERLVEKIDDQLVTVETWYPTFLPSTVNASVFTSYEYNDSTALNSKLVYVAYTRHLSKDNQDTVNYITNFEYIGGNLNRIYSAEGEVKFEYYNKENKLYELEKDFRGFNLFSPVQDYITHGAKVPLPSKKLPSKQIVKTDSLDFVTSYNWTVNANGYPQKVEVLQGTETRSYMYGYKNCNPVVQ
jgi:hypothetical protein